MYLSQKTHFAFSTEVGFCGGDFFSVNFQQHIFSNGLSDYVSEVKEAFDCIDEDGDGQISLDDLANFMQLIGMNSTTQSEIAEMITDHDTDG